MYYSFAYRNDGLLFNSWKPVAIAFDVTRRYLYCSAPIPDDLLPPNFNSHTPFNLAFASPLSCPSSSPNSASNSSPNGGEDRKLPPVPSPSELQWTMKLKLYKVGGACDQILFYLSDSELKERHLYEVEVTGLKRKLAKTEFPPPEPLLCPSTSLAGDAQRCRLDNKEFIEDPFFQKELFEGLHSVFSSMRLHREAREVAEEAAAAAAATAAAAGNDGSSAVVDGSGRPNGGTTTEPDATASHSISPVPSRSRHGNTLPSLLPPLSSSQTVPSADPLPAVSSPYSPSSSSSSVASGVPRRVVHPRTGGNLASTSSLGNRSPRTEGELPPVSDRHSPPASDETLPPNAVPPSFHTSPPASSVSQTAARRQRFRTLDSPRSSSHPQERGRASGEERREGTQQRDTSLTRENGTQGNNVAHLIISKAEAVKRDLLRFDTMQSYIRFLYVVRHVLGFDRLMLPPHCGLPAFDPRNGIRLTPLPIYLKHHCQLLEKEALYYCGYGMLPRRPLMEALETTVVSSLPTASGAQSSPTTGGGFAGGGGNSGVFPSSNASSSFWRFGSGVAYDGSSSGNLKPSNLLQDKRQRKGHFIMLNESMFFLHSPKAAKGKLCIECVQHFYNIHSLYYVSSFSCEMPCVLFVLRQLPETPAFGTTSSSTAALTNTGRPGTEADGAMETRTVSNERFGTPHLQERSTTRSGDDGREGQDEENGSDSFPTSPSLPSGSFAASSVAAPASTTTTATTTATPSTESATHPILCPASGAARINGDILFIPERPCIGGVKEHRYPLYRPGGVLPPSYFHHSGPAGGGGVGVSSPQTASSSSLFPSRDPHERFSPMHHSHWASSAAPHSTDVPQPPTFPTSAASLLPASSSLASRDPVLDQAALEERELMCLEVERIANIVEHFSLTSIDIQPVINIVPLQHCRTMTQFLAEVSSRIGRPLMLDYTKSVDRPRGPQLPGIWSSYRIRVSELAEQQLMQQNSGSTPVGVVPAVPIYMNHLNEVPLSREQVMELEEYAAFLQDHWREHLPLSHRRNVSARVGSSSPVKQIKKSTSTSTRRSPQKKKHVSRPRRIHEGKQGNEKTMKHGKNEGTTRSHPQRKAKEEEVGEEAEECSTTPCDTEEEEEEREERQERVACSPRTRKDTGGEKASVPPPRHSPERAKGEDTRRRRGDEGVSPYATQRKKTAGPAKKRRPRLRRILLLQRTVRVVVLATARLLFCFRLLVGSIPV